MRTGTVASTDNRNWELLPGNQPQRRFSQSRAIALDMESATIAANGFRFRVPYGTLLCVSDKPLHGEIKLPGMANHFYRERVDQHLRIGMRAIEMLRAARASTSCTAASCAASPRWRSSSAQHRRRTAVRAAARVYPLAHAPQPAYGSSDPGRRPARCAAERPGAVLGEEYPHRQAQPRPALPPSAPWRWSARRRRQDQPGRGAAAQRRRDRRAGQPRARHHRQRLRPARAHAASIR